MLIIKINFKSIIIIAAVILLLLSTNAFAFAQTTTGTVDEAVNNSVSGGPGFESIPARAFKPSDEGGSWEWPDGELKPESDSTTQRFDAALNLPNGATMTKLVVYYYDTSHVYDLTIFLYRKPLAGGLEQEIARIGSWYDDGYGYHATQDISYPEIDMQNYVYHIQVYFPVKDLGLPLRLVGVRVDYGYSTYLSLINK